MDAGRSYAAAAQSLSLAPSEGSSEKANTSVEVSDGYVYESYKQALVVKTTPTEAATEISAGSERPMTSHNPDAEYISELMSLLSRPESESQRAVIEAYRQISQKAGEVEKYSVASQDDGESSDQGHTSQKSLTEEHTLAGPETQPMHYVTSRAEDVLPDSPFNQSSSIPPMSLGSALVPQNRAAGSALVLEHECSSVSGKEDVKSESPTNMRQVRALLSEYGRNSDSDMPRDQWPHEGSRHTSLEDGTSYDHKGEADRFVIDRLVGPPKRASPPPEQQGRNTVPFSSGVDTASANWLPWQVSRGKNIRHNDMSYRF